MTSAPNHLPRLNGSKWLAILCLLIWASCSTPSKTVSTAPPVPKPEQRPEVYNPATGRYEPANTQNTKVDTVIWKESGQEPFIKDNAANDQVRDRTKRLNIVLLMPLSDEDLGKDINTEGSEKFFHYYAGLKMGLNKIKDSTPSVKVSVIPLKAFPDAIHQALKSPEIEDADLIVGPLRRDHLNETARVALQRGIPMAAPWNSFRTIENINSNYILLKASLPTHCEVLSQHIYKQFKPSDVCLVGRDKTKPLMNYFQSEAQKINKSGPPLTQSIVKDDYKFGDEYKYLDTTKSVYIVTEFEEPNIVFNFLRHINVMRRGRDVTVVGMPSWQDYSSDFLSLFSQLNVVISTSTFPDLGQDEVVQFRKLFFHQYQNFPLKEAYDGYDGIQYLVEMIKKYGRTFHQYGDMTTYLGLASDYRLEKIIDFTKPIDDRLNNVLCIENKALRVLKFDQYRFSKVQ